jgi:Ca2+-transporting ATPase
MRTQIGLIAKMLQNVEQEQTPLQRRLDQLGKVLGWAALAVCALVFIIGWMRGTPPLEMFIIAVSLAIAAVPEGLPAVVTISLALGMREMIQRNALIRRLSSVETLGSATVICSDKTGTLTQNEMTVTRIAADGEIISVSGIGYNPHGDFFLDGNRVNPRDFPAILTALWVGVLNNDAVLENSGESEGEITYRMVGDPTEGALVVAAAKVGTLPTPLNQAYPRIQEIPFDSERKRMITVHSVKDPNPDDISPFYNNKQREWFVIAEKGAPDIVLQQCSYYQDKHDQAILLDDEQRSRILAVNDSMTKDALRVLGVAYRVVNAINENGNTQIDQEELEKDLIFVGLIGMIDPSRLEVPPALKVAEMAGIRTVMITGDYPNTARAIAMEIGLMRDGHKVLTGHELDQLDDAQLQDQVKFTDVFARVSPQHKMRIVQALRANNEVVAMTGDGVNDAPSIKQADIGVAMGITGTDVTKEAADMVLTDDNYASIVSAVEQGRVIYSNIRKFVFYLLSCNLAEIAIIFFATLLGYPIPLTAIQLLWLNLITDGAPALALGVEKGDPDIMMHPPRHTKEPIINKRMTFGIAVQTIAITSVTLTAYFIGLNYYPEAAKTMAFVTLSFSELLRAFTARSEYYPILRIGLFTNKAMNWGVLISLILLLAVVYTPFLNKIFNTVPLVWAEWQYVLPLLFIPAIAAELTKLVLSQKQRKTAIA